VDLSVADGQVDHERDAFSGKIRIWSSCGDGSVFTYDAHAHPTLQNGDTWTFSWNVNSMDNRVQPDAAHNRDPSVYKQGCFP